MKERNKVAKCIEEEEKSLSCKCGRKINECYICKFCWDYPSQILSYLPRQPLHEKMQLWKNTFISLLRWASLANVSVIVCS